MEKRAVVTIRPQREQRAVVALTGDYQLGGAVPQVEQVILELAKYAPIRSVNFDCQGLGRWDSSLLTFVARLEKRLLAEGILVEREGLPKGARRLLELASAKQQGPNRGPERHPPFLIMVGEWSERLALEIMEAVAFLGEVSLGISRLVVGKAKCRWRDVLWVMERSSINALPIVSLISFLVGLILAFVGAVQLRMFGAQIFVAALVGIGIVRVLGAIMTGIIMAGRTGAAFAAELGTMQVNEEIDALRTMGINPVEFLVLPRLLGLAVMMPLLCLYSDLMGILGGLSVGVVMLDLNVQEYLNMTKQAVKPVYLWIGLFHSLTFGCVIGFMGCLQGIRSGRSASAVGQAATSAVVRSIVGIIVATAIITYLCELLGI